MAQQPMSLLSLPDELLVHIFNYLSDSLNDGSDLLPVLSVCHRAHNIAKPILYRTVYIESTLPATSLFQAALKQNPSLGQLVRSLNLWDAGLKDPDDKVVGRRMQAMLHALSNLKQLLVTDTEPYEVSAVLAALSTTALRVLVVHLFWTDDPSHWRGLQSQISRFSELRLLECQDPYLYMIPDRVLLHPSRHPDQHLSLPNLSELRTTDYIFLALFESAGSLRQALPNLQVLHMTMSRSRHASAVSACLSESSLFLDKLSISSETSDGVPGRWFSSLPAVRRLEISSKTFVDGAAESELLGYLATARGTLESLEFDQGVEVTDHLLRALTGVGRPPRLRRIRLDHVVQDSPEWISQDFELYGAAELHERAEDIRQSHERRWPVGGTAQGLQLALAAANENGIQVTGHALDCIEWTADFDRLLADHMMKQALKMDRYDYVIARFGAEAAIAWLKEHAPNTIQLLRAHRSALDMDDHAEP